MRMAKERERDTDGGFRKISVISEMSAAFVSAGSLTFSSAIWIQITAEDLEESVSEEYEAQHRETGRLGSPAPQCLYKLQQQGAEHSAEIKQDVGSTQHFKEN